MRLALIFRGISYVENFLHKYNIPLYTIDYRDTFPSIDKHLLQPYKDMGFDVDIFITTYHSKYENELLATFNPKKAIFRDYKQVPLGEAQIEIIEPLQIDQYMECFNLIEDYEKEHNFQYDNICITRFDLFFYKNVSEIDLDLNVFNYCFWHIARSHNSSYIFTNEDNFLFYPRSKNDMMKNALIMMKKDKRSTHLSSKYLLDQKETIKFLFGEKGDGAYDYPFYKFGRHIFGNARNFNSIEDNLSIQMNRIYHSEDEKINPRAIYIKG